MTRNPSLSGLERRVEGLGAKVALLAGLLLAVNPLHLWYSQEVRAYALMLFFGLLTVLFFELARVSPQCRWSPLYVGSGIATIALHKTGVLFPAFCLLCDAWPLGGWKREGRGWKPLSSFFLLRPPLRRLLVHLPLVIAAFIVLALKSFPPAEEYSRRTSGLEILYTGMTFVGGYSFGPSLTELQWHGPWVALYRHLPQVALLAAVLALVALTCLRNWHQLLPGKEVFLLALGIGCVAVYGLLSGFPYNVRYALPALFGFLALLAALVKAASGRVLTRISIAGVLMVALWADGQWFYGVTYKKGDSRAVARWLEQNRDRVKSWTVLPGYLSRSVEWYLQSTPQVLAGSIPAKQDRTTSFPPVPDVLILGRRHHLQQPDKLIADYEASAGTVRIVQAFTGFELYVRLSAAKFDARR